MDFNLQNKNGNMFIEPRTDGGIGIYYELSKETKSVCFAMSKDEMIKMAAWLIDWIDKNREP